MKKEELNEWGYPINKDSDKKIRQGMDFGTWVGLILILIMRKKSHSETEKKRIDVPYFLLGLSFV